jgi:signal transduction histidine kinase/CheY-like chemotaxis protein
VIKHYYFISIIWLSLLLVPVLSLAQNTYDTLSFFKTDLSTEEAELEFINAIHKHSNSAHEKARDLTFLYFQYAKDKKDSALIKSAYYQLGVIYLQDIKYDSALHCLQTAKKIATSQNDTKALITIERTIGAVYLSTKKNNQALNSFNTSLELAKASSDSVGMAKALNNLSILSSSANEYENALGYLKRSLDLKIAYAPKQEQISTLINIGNNYSNLHNYNKALDYLNRAKKMAIEFHEQKKLAEIWTHIAQINIITKNYDDAHEAFDNSMDISQNINDDAHLKLTVKKYAEFLMLEEKWEEAEVKLEVILSDLSEKQNPEFLMEIYYDLGKIAYETKNHLKAQAWLSQAVSINGVPHGEILEKSYNLLSLISYINGEYELAYHHLRISEFMSDSIQKNVNTDRLRELQVKYNSVNDKESIENLLEISELKENERQKSKFYFLITFSLFVITLAIAIALARQARIKHKQSTELTSQIEDNLNKTKDLIKANKLAEEGLKVKSEFIAMVSHEIRTPMNAIIGMSSLLSDTELTDYQKNYLNNISISSNNLLILLNDILDFSRVEAGKVSIKLHPADLSKELKHVVNMFQPLAHEKELDFQIDLDERIPGVAFIDAPRLRQVVVNLLSNAIKFTHKGFVKLSVQVTATEPTLNGEMVTLRFSVEDSGIGVPKDKQKEIFSSFNQLDSKVSRQYSGVGLGLSISQGILGMMGSTIKLESEFARGSTLWFDIKIKAEKDGRKLVPSGDNTKVKFDKELGITCPLRILIAEDNEINQKLLKINLNKMGYNPIIVSNGQEALDQIKIQDFDIVFMDVQMPILDGVSATKEIVRMYGSNKPVIVAVTANAMGTDKQSYIDAGMDDYISKPFTTKEIESCLRNWHAHLNA